MGMPVVLSNNITSTNANAAVSAADGSSALTDGNVLGGFVIHIHFRSRIQQTAYSKLKV